MAVSEDLASDGNIKQYLDAFCNYQKSYRNAANLSWDHALLLTGLDLYSMPDMDMGSSGMSYQSGMCSEESSCTVAELSSPGASSLIVAHELAHSIGVSHDGEGDNLHCNPHSYIMGPKLSPRATHWSPCSMK